MNHIKTYFIELARLFKEHTTTLFQIIAAFLLPIQSLLVLVGMMIVLDTVTGIWKAKKIKEPISSKKLSRVVSKMVLYQVGVITFFALETYMLGEFVAIFTAIPFFLTKVVAIFFCSIELISINENIKAGYGLNFFELFKKLLHRANDVKKEITELKKDSD